MKEIALVATFTTLLLVAYGAPADPNPTPASKAIALIHHLAYLIDYLVQYVIGSENDRKTPQEAADYYQKALLEGQTLPGQDSKGLKPDNARARQETEIIHKMMKV